MSLQAGAPRQLATCGERSCRHPFCHGLVLHPIGINRIFKVTSNLLRHGSLALQMSAVPLSPAVSAALAAPLIASISFERRSEIVEQPACSSAPTFLAAAHDATAEAGRPSQSSPPLPDLRCLNGLRVASCLAVMLFHCWLGLWQGLLPYEVTAPLTRHHWFVR